VIVEFVCLACHSLFGSGLAVPRIGSKKMNEASIVILWSLQEPFGLIMSYSVGFREGQRQGYTRGRAVARHAVSAERKAVK
jgi:hypothetical protein